MHNETKTKISNKYISKIIEASDSNIKFIKNLMMCKQWQENISKEQKIIEIEELNNIANSQMELTLKLMKQIEDHFDSK
jgi:hypothetical protein